MSTEIFNPTSIQPPNNLTIVWDTWGQEWHQNPTTNLWVLQKDCKKGNVTKTWNDLLQYFAPLYVSPPLMYDKWEPGSRNLSYIYVNTLKAADMLENVIKSVDQLYGSPNPARNKTKETIEETEFWAETRGVLSSAYNVLTVWRNMIEDGRHPENLSPEELDPPQPAKQQNPPRLKLVK